MIKIFILITSDDLQPQTIPLFEQYWKPLKQKHPELKITFFVAPNNQEFNQGNENNIETSQEFRDWYGENKDWVSIEIHGNDHRKPPENLRSYEEQKEIISKSILALRDYIDIECLGYKPPFCRADENTLKVLNEFGFSFFNNWWTLTLLRVNKRRMPPYIEIGTHTTLPDANCPDNINKVYEQLDQKLAELENLGYRYATMRELVKAVVQ